MAKQSTSTPGLITVRDIAKAASCSPASVSRALRGQGKVSPKLRRRIEQLAEKMGYKPNPLVSSLMATRNQRSERHRLRANIAWLNNHPDKNTWTNFAYRRPVLDAAHQRSKELGYGFEEIWSFEPGLTGTRLGQIMRARGVAGILVPSNVELLGQLGFDWSPFSVVCLGDYYAGQKDWHRAGCSNRKNVETAFNSLRHLGYRRIGLALGFHLLDEEPESLRAMKMFNAGKPCDASLFRHAAPMAILAGFAFCQMMTPKADRVPPFAFRRNEDDFMQKIAEWVRQTRLDALICGEVKTLEAIRTAGLRVPEDLALAHLNLADDVPGWAGIDTKKEQQAASAIDLLNYQILHNQRDEPPFVQTIYIEGEWRDGWTAPPKK